MAHSFAVLPLEDVVDKPMEKNEVWMKIMELFFKPSCHLRLRVRFLHCIACTKSSYCADSNHGKLFKNASQCGKRDVKTVKLQVTLIFTNYFISVTSNNVCLFANTNTVCKRFSPSLDFVSFYLFRFVLHKSFALKITSSASK